MHRDPLHQFIIVPIIPLSINGIDISFTNSSFFMTLATISIIFIFYKGVNKADLKPGRLQVVTEFFFNFINDTIKTTAGTQGLKHFPMIFHLTQIRSWDRLGIKL